MCVCVWRVGGGAGGAGGAMKSSFLDTVHWDASRGAFHCLHSFDPAPLTFRIVFYLQVVQIMQGRSDRLTYRSVNVMSPEEAAAKDLPSVYTLPGTNGASELVSNGGARGRGGATC